ncbi:hypothetical protein CAEBREN_16111 [Caenorhabditis brenneri]|uniref:G-protein coupled receptors family 1 profile domain-containing protein n=1 Tax=Caenorhabditis brenneri TaxID=135651 RepID=G0NHR7_CAEBE|nr:hypothetical protein CAEBREN_16111 [Caenorhabditis brenneri]
MVVYARLILAIFWFKTISKSPDLSLFYVKFVLDFVLSLISFLKLICYGLAVTRLSEFIFANHWLTFSVAWPVNLLTATRGILLLFIAMDRTFATYFPIMFFKYRKFIPTFLIVGIVMSYTFVDTLVAFVSCQPNLNLPTTCVSAMCILGPCYQNYSLKFQQICYSLISFVTLLLAIKLLIWNKCKNQIVNRDLRRANRLAFIECAIIIIFDLIPPIVHSVCPSYFDYVGAINSVAQTLGFVVEAFLTVINLQQRYQTKLGSSTGNIFVRSGVADPSAMF